MWIAFLGADGAGKSTVIREVNDYLNTLDKDVVYQHWKPCGRKSQGKLNHKTVENPHGQKERGAILSYMKLVYLWCIWWSYALKVTYFTRARKVVIFDRCYWDLLIDPKRYRYRGSTRLTKLFLHCMPQFDVLIILDADTDVLLGRKQEVAKDELSKIVCRYRKLEGEMKNMHLINTEESLDSTIISTIEVIRSYGF